MPKRYPSYITNNLNTSENLFPDVKRRILLGDIRMAFVSLTEV